MSEHSTRRAHGDTVRHSADAHAHAPATAAPAPSHSSAPPSSAQSTSDSPPEPLILPSLVLHTICDLLHTDQSLSDLARLMRVNKELHDIAARHLYAKLKLTEYNVHAVVRGLSVALRKGLPEAPQPCDESPLCVHEPTGGPRYRTDATTSTRKGASLSFATEITVECFDRRHMVREWVARRIDDAVFASVRVLLIKTKSIIGRHRFPVEFRAERLDGDSPARNSYRICTVTKSVGFFACRQILHLSHKHRDADLFVAVSALWGIRIFDVSANHIRCDLYHSDTMNSPDREITQSCLRRMTSKYRKTYFDIPIGVRIPWSLASAAGWEPQDVYDRATLEKRFGSRVATTKSAVPGHSQILVEVYRRKVELSCDACSVRFPGGRGAQVAEAEDQPSCYLVEKTYV